MEGNQNVRVSVNCQRDRIQKPLRDGRPSTTHSPPLKKSLGKDYINQVGVARPTLKVGGTMFGVWVLDCINLDICWHTV